MNVTVFCASGLCSLSLRERVGVKVAACRADKEGAARNPAPTQWRQGGFISTDRRTHTPVIQHALAVAQEAARRAGEVILSYYSSCYEIRSKGVDNPATTADLAANHVLRE